MKKKKTELKLIRWASPGGGKIRKGKRANKLSREKGKRRDKKEKGKTIYDILFG